MKIERQIEEIDKYFKANEKGTQEFKLGVEFEQIIVDSDSLETVSFYGPNGVAETLKELLSQGWQGDYCQFSN